MAANNWPAEVWEDGQWFVRLEMGGGVLAGDPLDDWERDSAMRDRVRPIIADEAKSQQFLAAKRLILDFGIADHVLGFCDARFLCRPRHCSPGVPVATMDQTSGRNSSRDKKRRRTRT